MLIFTEPLTKFSVVHFPRILSHSHLNWRHDNACIPTAKVEMTGTMKLREELSDWLDRTYASVQPQLIVFWAMSCLERTKESNLSKNLWKDIKRDMIKIRVEGESGMGDESQLAVIANSQAK